MDIHIYDFLVFQHLPDGSAPSAQAEFYLLPDPYEVSRRKTRTAPKGSDPTYNELVSTVHFFPALFHGITEWVRLEGPTVVIRSQLQQGHPRAHGTSLCPDVLGYHQ